ncbi:nuclear exosome regulator NRDE2 [Venturia canescens]|uniref:nuclear exosome regulator NRDE2 n=1 Tax=Venturia canescens TaxID=32260 RepID=UPI001C9C5140|nr:nuclear exosome regulator NRDE2 [Venturia canescens]
MSLFPAYKTRLRSLNDDNCEILGAVGGSENWLKNSSFPGTSKVELSSESSDDEPEELWEIYAQNKYRTSPLGKSKAKVSYEPEVKNVYYEQRRRDPGNSLVGTLPAKIRPEYFYMRTSLGFLPHDFQPQKKETVIRYYSTNIGPPLQDASNMEILIKLGSMRMSTNNVDFVSAIESHAPTQEDEHKVLTREFNEKLAASPHDVELWLQYVKFQDVAQRFGNSPSQQNKTAICQKKLSVIEKALEINPSSKELLKEKLALMGEIYPADQLSDKIESLLNKNTDNVSLWQAFIMVTQSSVAACTVPKIMNIYTKCFSTLTHGCLFGWEERDGRLLEMLFHCLVFLRQAGLWEQMWLTLRMNLNLNLSLSMDALPSQKSIDEKKLIELEEVILTSRLPLNQLWLRVESLRENCHWIGVKREELEVVGDSHRFVSPEDVTDYVHSMMSRKSNMRLAIYALIVLKVPLLPTSDSILKDLGLEKCSWTIDSVEPLLPMFYPMVGELAGYRQRKLLLKGILAGGLTSGPQYLSFHPAQEPYLDFVRDTFRAIAESLSSPTERTSLYIWWLRFERMLVYLCEDEIKSENRRKKLKGILKEFLKKEENRNNLYFYREYALIEREMGRVDNCVTILEKAIDTAASTTNEDNRVALLNLQRTLVEVLLDVRIYNLTKKTRVNNVLCRILPSDWPQKDIQLVEVYLHGCLTKFLAEPLSEEIRTLDQHFLPFSICDQMACYVYLLYVNNRNDSEIFTIFDACLEHSKDFKYMHERFYENQIVILQLMYERSPSGYSRLLEKLNSALNYYPDNFYFLSVFAAIESELPNWKLSTRKEINRPWQALSFCLARRARINSSHEKGMMDAVIAANNKLRYFHRTLARTAEIRHCPLVWRLLMLLLREQNLSQERGEEVYHESVAQCPWSRSIYIDVAEVAPQFLTQIQDVIREKDLRMHVTPEELHILRGE